MDPARYAPSGTLLRFQDAAVRRVERTCGSAHPRCGARGATAPHGAGVGSSHGVPQVARPTNQAPVRHRIGVT